MHAAAVRLHTSWFTAESAEVEPLTASSNLPATIGISTSATPKSDIKTERGVSARREYVA